MTHEFRVEDMACWHCASRVTNVLNKFDPEAQIRIDVVARFVSIDGAAGRSDYAYAIRDAGYRPAQREDLAARGRHR